MQDISLHYDCTLDVTGLSCPLLIIRTKSEIRKLPNGSKLLIISSDPSFAIDCQVFARQGGHKLLKSWEEQQKFYFILEKSLVFKQEHVNAKNYSGVV